MQIVFISTIIFVKVYTVFFLANQTASCHLHDKQACLTTVTDFDLLLTLPLSLLAYFTHVTLDVHRFIWVWPGPRWV